MGPDAGVNPVTVGGVWTEIVAFVVTVVLLTPLVSVTFRDTVKVPALV
jgi:hypothetical protein